MDGSVVPGGTGGSLSVAAFTLAGNAGTGATLSFGSGAGGSAGSGAGGAAGIVSELKLTDKKTYAEFTVLGGVGGDSTGKKKKKKNKNKNKLPQTPSA